MTLGRRIAYAVAAGWLNRVVTVLATLVLTRVLFARLPDEEQGFWVLLGNSPALISILDLGLSFTLTRRVALARGKSGADPHAVLTEETLKEVGGLVATGRLLYRYIAVVVFLMSVGLGFLFLTHLKYTHMDPRTVWLAWIILCVGYGINVWAQVWPCLMNGMGLVGLNTVADTVITVSSIVAQIVVVLNGGGILGLAIVVVISSLAGRQVSVWLTRRAHPELFKEKAKWSPVIFRSLISPAMRAWLTGMGAFWILKTDEYFISYFLDPSLLPQYRAGYQIVSNVMVFAVSIGAGSVVYVSHLWQAGEMGQVHAIFRRSARMGMILMVCGVACLAVAGKQLIDLWLGPGHFIGYPILWTFCLNLALEAHNAILVNCSRATEDEAFAWSALLGGLLNFALTFILLKWLGLWGVALGTLFAQLFTNNWYILYRSLRRLRIGIWDHVTGVLLPTFLIFLAAFVPAYLAVQLTLPVGSALLTLFAAVGVTGAVMVISLWFKGLDVGQRARIKRRLFPKLNADSRQP